MEARPQSSTHEAQSASLFKGPLKLLVETGLLLARERSVDTIVQAALDAGRELCGAQWGAFFYTEFAADGAPCPLYKLSGQTAEQHAKFLLPTANSMLVETLFGSGTVRCADISDDAHFGPGTPFAPLTAGPDPVRSYFAVPVHSASGEMLGGIIYGHTAPHVFTAQCEPLIEAVAAQAAVAVDNTRLHEHLSRQATEAGAARQLQRETADRLAQVFEATTDAVLLCDRHWRITYMNSRAKDIVAGGKNLTGQAIWEAFPEAVGSVFYQHYADVMSGAGPREFTELYPPLSLWVSVKVYPTAEGIAVFFQDITEERRLARDKAEADRRLRQALDAAQLGTWTWDRATDILDLDDRAANLLHFKPHLPVSRSDLRNRIVVEDDRPLTMASLQHAVETGSLYQAEYRVISAQGTHCWISARGMPTFAPDSSEVVGMIGTVQDITLRKTQESALRQSEKLAATGRLAATIAHEINNPLEAITNLIYLVKTDPAIPPTAQHLLETADQELARVSQIAQQTLGFYRDTTRPTDIDISGLLTSVINLFHRKLTYKRIDHTLDLEPGLHVFGLQGELRQVFSNLIVNSIDASLHGRITIRSRRRSVAGIPGVSVLICDEGSGIPSAVRDRLFSPFFTTKLSVGTGLGLWVTRGIVEKQGGSIRFRSSATPPTGTIFRVFLRATGENLLPASPDPAILQ
jgi:PAS domain S-box-containing protein